VKSTDSPTPPQDPLLPQETVLEPWARITLTKIVKSMSGPKKITQGWNLPVSQLGAKQTRGMRVCLKLEMWCSSSQR
jgi:hypothetical protein